jgi:hypothetical protein
MKPMASLGSKIPFSSWADGRIASTLMHGIKDPYKQFATTGYIPLASSLVLEAIKERLL